MFLGPNMLIHNDYVFLQKLITIIKNIVMAGWKGMFIVTNISQGIKLQAGSFFFSYTAFISSFSLAKDLNC